MAYEHMTYDAILERMLARITEKNPNIDTREGSMIYDAVAPAAMELAINYVELENIRKETFILTATREGKIQRCKEIGIDTDIFNASYGVFKGLFDVEVPMGSRWNLDLYNYTVTKGLGMNEDGYFEYHLTCETLGTAPNGVFGMLTPILDTYTNLHYAELVEVLIEGDNESSDAEIDEYYINIVDSKTTDGNVSQYKQWCSDYNGIGNHRVFPLWNGKNTVKVSILSTSNRVASEELINEFQEYLDPNIEGMGNGKAPIGAFVTVTTATEVPINITGTISMKDGYTDTSVIDNHLTNYFASLAYDKKSVGYMNVGAAILNADGVEFVTNLLMNGDTSDIILGDEEIPILGTANWTVV